MSLTQFEITQPNYFALQFLDTATPGAWVQTGSGTVFTRLFWSVQIANSDTIAHNVAFDWNNQDGSGIAGSVLVPARAGYDGNTTVDVLAVLQPASWHAFYLTVTNDVGVMVAETINTGRTLTVRFEGGSF